MNRVDPRILRTRQLLKDAFIELLGEMDVEKITVNRLAERAMINRVTFYLHYRDIPDLMDKMSEEMLEDIKRILPEVLSARWTVRDEEAPLVSLLEHIKGNAKFYKAVLADRRIPIFTERLLKLITQLLSEHVERKRSEAGAANHQVQKDIAVWYGSSALIGVIVSWLRNDMPYTPHYLAKQFVILTSRC